MGDPFVLQHDGHYYLFGTTKTSEGFEYFRSEDLVHWRRGGWAWKRTDTSWATALFWAPEVCHYRDKFYMVYSGRVRGGSQWEMRLALAVSDRPEGPYEDLHAPLFDFGYSAIDGHIFVDDDRRPYLYFSRNESRDGYSYGVVCGIALADDLSKVLGEPVTLIEASQPWERVNWTTNRCNEGPAVIKNDGTYYMTYSANNTGTQDYGIGVATAKHPLGPWTKYEGNPIAATDLSIGVSGPGHNSITRSPDGRELFMVYHRHEDVTNPDGPRVVCIDRLFFDADGLLRLKGPTCVPQPMPSAHPPD
jgi:GH43 family beta-xylosidase